MDCVTLVNSSIREETSTVEWKIRDWNLLMEKKVKFSCQPIDLLDSKITLSMSLDFDQQVFSVELEPKCSKIIISMSEVFATLLASPHMVQNRDLATRDFVSSDEKYGIRFRLPSLRYLKHHAKSTNDMLIFRFNLIIYWNSTVMGGCNKNAETQDDDFEENSYHNCLTLDDCGSLYEDKTMCDVTFVIGTEELKAHRVILAMVSPYFLAMFSHDSFKENSQRIVDLTADADVTLELYKCFLDYVYGLKSVYDLGHVARDLYILADKYQMEFLKSQCEHYLCDSVNIENVGQLMHFSVKYDCKVLLKKTITVAKNNMDIIRNWGPLDNPSEYKEFMLHHLLNNNLM